MTRWTSPQGSDRRQGALDHARVLALAEAACGGGLPPASDDPSRRKADGR